MTDYKDKLKQLAVQPYWKRLAFTLVVNAFFLWRHLADLYLYLNFYFPRRRFVLRRQPRAHYLGYPRQHPHRFAFVMLAGILISAAIAIPDHNTTMQWVIGWGVLFSLWVTTHSLVRVARRIRS